MPINYFDAPLARSYEAKWPELFDPAVIDPVVGFLTELAGGGRRSSSASAPGGSPYEVASRAGLPPYWVTDGQLETRSVPFRYVWPSELDLMARLAGMRLPERWSDWARTPFTGDSTQHVSVWERVDQGIGAPTARMPYPRAGS